MNRQQFERQGEARWREAESLLTGLDDIKHHTPEAAAELPRVFRQLCSDLALAEGRMYGSRLCDRLNALVIRAQQHLYKQRGGAIEAFVRAVFDTFPRAVREEWRLFWLCTALFLVPFLATIFLVQHDLRWADAILGPAGMEGIQEMYGEGAEDIGELRNRTGANFRMFGFYIMNNIGIDFRIFAGGILAGIGTTFFLLYNGIHIGATVGYVEAAGDPVKLWTFVAGHSAPELIGMIIAGVAGWRMGLGLIRPGRLKRGDALVAATRRALPLIVGAAVMTFVAACIEGFWSARYFAPWLKYSVGIAVWLIFAAYLLLAGRDGGVHHPAPSPEDSPPAA